MRRVPISSTMTTMVRTSYGAGAFLTGLAAALVLFGPAAPVRADEASIVVVLESSVSRIDAGALRRELEEQLGMPVVSLVDARARTARGVLSIVVDDSGRRAAVQFRPQRGLEYSVQISVEAAEARGRDWVVAAAASVVRASDAWASARTIESEILDPWNGERAPYLASSDPMLLPAEVIDPFAGSMHGPIRITSAEFVVPNEVIDPWAGAVEQPRMHRGLGDRLSRPAPGRTARPAR
jgi:hypothetical protein